MSIQGSLEQYTLPEILLSLSMNQQTGTLSFQLSDDTQRDIYFLKGAIFVIYSENQSISELERLLVTAKRATAKQMKTAMRSQEQSHRFIGDILIEMGLIQEPHLLQLLESFIDDTLFAIFLDEKATFAFHLNEVPPQFSFPLPSVINQANGHVLGCLNHISQWREIGQYFPTRKEIYRFIQNPQSLPLDDLTAEEKSELRHIDGQKQVCQIFELTFLSHLRMVTIMAQLVKQGALQLLTMEEALKQALALQSKGRFEEAMVFYSYGQTIKAPVPQLYYQYAEVLLGLGRTEEAVENYKTAADIFFDQSNYDYVLQAYMKILSIDASNIGVLEKLFDAYLRSAKKEETLAIGEKLGTLLTSQGEFQNAILVYSHLVKLFPRELGFRKALANSYHQVDDIDMATQQLNIIRRMEMETQRHKKEKIGAFIRKIVILLIIIAIGAASYFTYNYFTGQQKASRALNRAQTTQKLYEQQLKDPLNFASEEEIEKKIDELKILWKKARSFGYVDEADSYLEANSGRLDKLEKDTRDKFQAIKGRLIELKQLQQQEATALQKENFKRLFELRKNKLVKYGPYLKQKSVRLPLLLQISPFDARVFLNGTRIKNQPNRPGLYFYTYSTDTNLLEIEVKKNEYASKKFSIKYPNQYQGEISIFLNRELQWREKLSDGILQSPLVAEGNLFVMTRGGEIYCFSMDEKKKGSGAIQKEWLRKAGDLGETFSPFTSRGEYMMMGTARGELLVLSFQNTIFKQSLSRYPLIAPPVSLNRSSLGKNLILVADLEGKIHLLKFQQNTLKKVGSISLPGLSIKAKPLHIFREGRDYLLLASQDHTLRLLQLTSQKGAYQSIWTIATSGAFVTEPLEYNGVVMVGDTKGLLYGFDFKTGSLLWTYKTQGAFYGGITMVGKNLFACGNVAGEFFVFSLTSNNHKIKITWKKKLLPLWSTPVFSRQKGILYVGTSLSYRKNYIFTRSGKKKVGRIIDLSGNILQVEDKNFNIYSIPMDEIKRIKKGAFVKKGFLYALDPGEKKELWRLPVDGGIVSSPVFSSSESLVIFGTTRGEIISIKQ